MYNLRNQLVAFGLLVALFGLAPVAGYGQDPAPPTAITYQGRLSEAGMPANGAYDLEFRLFTSEDVTTGSILTKILAQVLKDRPGLLECFEEEGQARKDEYLSNISIEAKDLNRDRQPEFFVEPSGGCDCGVRNCSLWVYRQTTTGYSLILETDGIGLAAERTQTNGYLDIAIEAQGTAFTRFRTLYKFDGRQYREHKTDFINMETGEVKPASRRVQFPRGSTSTIVSGRVSPGFGDTYLIGARAGQRMN